MVENTPKKRGRKPGMQETPIGTNGASWRTGGSADMATVFTRDGKPVEPGTGGRNPHSSFNGLTSEKRKEKPLAPVASEATVTTESTVIPEATVVTVAPDHACHMVLDEPNGSITHGKCKGCGREKDYKNWIGEGAYHKDNWNELAN